MPLVEGPGVRFSDRGESLDRSRAERIRFRDQERKLKKPFGSFTVQRALPRSCLPQEVSFQEATPSPASFVKNVSLNKMISLSSRTVNKKAARFDHCHPPLFLLLSFPQVVSGNPVSWLFPTFVGERHWIPDRVGDDRKRRWCCIPPHWIDRMAKRGPRKRQVYDDDAATPKRSRPAPVPGGRVRFPVPGVPCASGADPAGRDTRERRARVHQHVAQTAGRPSGLARGRDFRFGPGVFPERDFSRLQGQSPGPARRTDPPIPVGARRHPGLQRGMPRTARLRSG